MLGISKQKKNSNLKGENNIIITTLKGIVVILLIFIQILEIWLVYTTTTHIYNYATLVFYCIKFLIVIYILYKHSQTAYKLSWVLFITFLPVAGIVVYLLWGNSELRKKKEKSLNDIEQKTMKYLENPNVEQQLLDIDKTRYLESKFITNVTGYPLYENEGVKYYPSGESFFDDVKEDLKKANKFIIIEFYLISKGKMWDEIFEVLRQKAEAGVKINIIVDSFGSLQRKPKNFVNEMKKYGIEVTLFNPFTTFTNGYFNYRDHRKIIVIDGVIAYTCGMNLADEYVNILERYGHWKDCGIKIIGKPVLNYLIMVLRTLQGCVKYDIDFKWYKDVRDVCLNIIPVEKIGYIVSYSDGPNNKKNPSENVYIQMINFAKNYVYITTPYFIIDELTLTALLNSARSGVDVRIIFPHIPDKKVVNMITKSFYEVILEAGIKVYEYKPGFIHSKSFISDDDLAIVGSANLDFRSFHMNFESATWMYKTGEEIKIKKDFLNTLKECEQIDYKVWKKRNIFVKIIEAILSAFAPMM